MEGHRRDLPPVCEVNRPYHELEHHGICFGFGGIFKIQNGGSARENISQSYRSAFYLAFYLVRVFPSYSRDSGSRLF